MGLLRRIIGSGEVVEEEKVLPWISLNEEQQIDYIIKKSHLQTQVIFKHSTRCGISSMVMRQFTDDFDINAKHLDLNYLDILNYRHISNLIAEKLQVVHESPQLLVIKNGNVVKDASHGRVNEIDLNTYI